ncbi:Protein SMG9 [Papilio xuthus]|uniref:Protein SMG9 n=1 Tax=Papilio xuthus TaxID=66420 RepID=A0A194PIQ7_PAPXU|nr:Protein SMG9 [Papilio xuthus]
MTMLNKHELPDSKNARCLLACVYRRTTWMDEKGMFMKENAYKLAQEKHPEDKAKLEKSKELFELCSKVNEETFSDGEEGCERAAKLTKCLTENAPKEAATRRPMILKSDRDRGPSQDQNKDKQEKEKQPTIILKTREQNAPREERPQSPKAQTSESDGYHPQKIAQNENKDKKIVESKPTPTLKLMSNPIKLLDENLEFSQSALKYLQDCNTNYLVVGIMGTQGVGKSMILNLIAQNTPLPDLCTEILKSHDLPNTEANDVAIENQMENLNIANTSNETNNSFFKFKMQDIEQIERGAHCTRGVDMYVTNDRVILLDCQPLWSPSLIDESNNVAMNPRCANIVTWLIAWKLHHS